MFKLPDHIEGTPGPDGDIPLAFEVYEFDPVTMEFTAPVSAFISYEDLKEGIIKYHMPANSVPFRPEPQKREVAVFDIERGQWGYVVDWRGVVFWQGTTRYVITERAIAPPSDAVFVEPPVIKNTANRRRLLDAANERVAILLDARTLGVITDTELKALDAWKLYRVQLNRMDDLNSESPEWPTIPE